MTHSLKPQTSLDSVEEKPSQLAGLLREPASEMPFLNKLKTRYRPYICPLEWVLSEIPHESRLFDIGCGAGALLYLADRLRGVRMAHGYDVDVQAVAAARCFEPLVSADWQVSCLPSEQTPPSLAEYDVISMVDVLHHIPPVLQQGFLNRLADGMTPGTRLVLKDIDASKTLGCWMNQLHDLILAREWVHPRSRLKAVAMLEAAGLLVLRHETRWSWWYPHFLVVAEKA